MSSVSENNKKKVAVALSGGIDSSVSAYILKQQEFDGVGITGMVRHSETLEVAAKKAAKIAEKIGIEHHILDLSDKFKQHVIDYFQQTYQRGATPNPCILCNKHIKWGAIFDFAMNTLGCDYYATGHYSKIEQKDGRYLLYPSDDADKDQIYYLFELSQEQLSKTIFPLSGYKKSEIKKIAFELGFADENTYKESQDVCFIPKTTNTQKYLSDLFGKKEGDFVEIHTKKRLGIHNGYYHYTIGQRKGIGIAYSEPLYVVDIDAEENIVYLGTRKDLFVSNLELHNLKFMDTPVNNEFSAFVKIRNNMPQQKAKVIMNGEHDCSIMFENPVSAVTKGQAAVLYDINDGHLIGGTWI